MLNSLFFNARYICVVISPCGSLLSIPQIILTDIFTPPSDELGMQLYVGAYNTIFLFVAVSVAYGMGSCIVGQTARLPLVAEAADSQVRDSPGGW